MLDYSSLNSGYRMQCLYWIFYVSEYTVTEYSRSITVLHIVCRKIHPSVNDFVKCYFPCIFCRYLFDIYYGETCILYYCILLLAYLYLLLDCNSNVEEVIRFPDVKAQRQLTYGAKQLIAREVRWLLHAVIAILKLYLKAQWPVCYAALLVYHLV